MTDHVEIPSPFQEAYDKFIKSVSAVDAARFENLTLDDIRETALAIETSQAKRRSLRNLRRIEPLLEGLGKYGKTIEVLCNQTPYLAFIWAPIALVLQLANEHTAIFEKLIRAYSLIAESLPRFARYQSTFQDRPEMRHILGLIYSDILEFHGRTYSFFHRKAWQMLFDTLWKDFSSRFSSIIESLTRHRDLIDKEATSIDIAEARVWRVREQEELENRERDKRIQQLNRTVNWLSIDNSIHMPDDDLYRFSKTRLRGTCKWILRDQILVKWRETDENHRAMWMKGIPGAGKTVLSACIIQDLLKDPDFSVAYYFCDSNSNVKDLCGAIIRSLAIQLVQQNPTLAVHVDTKYVSKGIPPSRAQLGELVPELLDSIEACRVVIDGIDESSEADQKEILTHTLRLFTGVDIKCKILFSSRECTSISRILRKVPTISLSQRTESLEKDIKLFIRQSLIDLRKSWPNSLIDEIEQKMLKKAAGMFLWVRLVVSELQESLSLKELTEAVDDLPEGLHKAYHRLLDRIQKKHGESHRQKAYFILHWIAGSLRTMKTCEVQNGVVLGGDGGSLNDSTRLPSSIFELCKPIIEEGSENTIRFVHFSARQYILHKMSGPFFDEITANRTIIRGLTAYIPMASSLIDTSVPEARSLLSVCKGFHDLHNFVHDFWSDHVVNFMMLHSIRKRKLSKDDLHLLDKFQILRRGVEEDGDMATVVPLSPQQLDHISTLQQLPKIHGLVKRFLCFRASLRSEQYAAMAVADREAYELRHDPTLLTEISQKYKRLIWVLFKCDDLDLSEQFSPDIIAEFREKHSGSAFPCRYRFCARASSGFPTEREREAHETSHRPRIKCPITSCEFYLFGLGNKQALDRHNSRYHKDLELGMSQGARLVRKKFDLALRKHFVESDLASTQLKRPRNDPSLQLSHEDLELDKEEDLKKLMARSLNEKDSKFNDKTSAPKDQLQTSAVTSQNDDPRSHIQEQSAATATKEELLYTVGQEVAFKKKLYDRAGNPPEFDWILGQVTRVIGEDKSRHYEVKEIFPENPESGDELYKISASQMIPILPEGSILEDYEVGKVVLAQYLEASTFYRAIVKGTIDEGSKVELLFDDELLFDVELLFRDNTSGIEKIVERRWVLDYKD